MSDDENFKRVMAGLEEVAAIMDGRADPSTYRVHYPVDVKAIRHRQGLTQTAFAARYGFSAAAVRDWEQNRRRPDASARTLLRVIDKEPEAVERALALSN